MLQAATAQTPIGTLYLISDEQLVLGAGFRSFRDLLNRMEPNDAKRGISEVKKISVISDLISDYFDGDVQALNGLKVRQPGSKFAQDIWKAMRKIPAGKTLSYAKLAERVGNPKAIRAAGTVCGKNIIAPIVPCHRVVKTGGELGNYGYGIKIKEWLLNHEAAH